MRKIFTLMCLFAMVMTAQAQQRLITGKLTDKESKEPLSQVTLQLLKTDSTFVAGAISDDNGNFSLQAEQNGRYILRFSSVGYTDVTKNVTVADNKNVRLGNITMSADAIMLSAVTALGNAPKVVLKEDTFVYNTSAYRVAEGSAIEELVKKLPGAQVSDDGKITINGKEVKKIRVDGKEFMTGDTQTALKNLPTSIVDQVKAYDERSDLSRITGIDDGEEETVLDFGLKRGMNKGMFANVDAAIGTHDRYAERVMGAYFFDNSRLMIMGNANNTNDQGFPGGGGGGRFGGGQQGLNTAKMLGLNYNYEAKDKLKMDASVRWNHRNGDLFSKNSSENFVSVTKSFSNNTNQNYTRSNSWNGQFRLEWTPDTMTNIMFRPSISLSSNDGNRSQKSATYKDDPYLYVTDPLSPEGLKKLAEDSLMVNSNENVNLSYGESTSARGMLQFNRRLGSKGRNITLRVDGNYSDNDNTSISMNDVHLYQQRTIMGLDSTYQTNRYNLTPSKSWGYNLQTTYSEPIAKGMFLQFSYRYQYRYNESDRSTYDFSSMGRLFFDGITPAYRNWDAYLSRTAGPLENYKDDDLSRYSEYTNYIHDIQLTYRWIDPKFQLNAGFMLQPQRSYYLQDYQGVHVDTVRNVTNFSPTLDFRYRFSKVSNLRVNYRGSTSQPGMSDLLDIVDDSDPLNISMGNPGLKPSFTNNFRLFYNNYISKHQQGIMTFVNFSTTRNSISNKVTYNEKTGGRTTRPENINGNWNVMGAFMYNMAIDTIGHWNVNTFTNVNHSHYVGYLSLGMNQDSQKNVTKTTTFGERLSFSYRNDWLEVEPNGNVNYTKAENKLQPNSDLDTWQFSYGLNVVLRAPWGMQLASDIHQNSRRGYNDNSMNTDELVWNAQLSQSFLRGNALTVSLQLYDILKEQSTFSRVLNAMQRSDTEYNSITSYAMLHVIYRINIFGGRHKEDGQMPGPGQFGRPGGWQGGQGRPGGWQGGGGGGRPGGWGGGGRPGGGFGGPMMVD